MFKALFLFVMDKAAIFFASLISFVPGAVTISMFGCFSFINFISSLKYGHLLCCKLGEQNGKISINFCEKIVRNAHRNAVFAQR